MRAADARAPFPVAASPGGGAVGQDPGPMDVIHNPWVG
jgi:hypothetical protein